MIHLLRQHQPVLYGFGHLQEWYAHLAAPTYWGDFSGRSDKANLMLMFSAIIGRSERETRCPAHLTHQASPRIPTSDTRGGKLRSLCSQFELEAGSDELPATASIRERTSRSCAHGAKPLVRGKEALKNPLRQHQPSCMVSGVCRSGMLILRREHTGMAYLHRAGQCRF